ncbi:hypothetical protein Q0M94_28275 (plasmid) [Deinococcus radiomollis]|uniref:hypothetical protein n=1 Tax=Deinococcus radiomollis TaxID=468916 RepID=UPI0038913503
MTTFYAFLNTIPDFGGRVYRSTFPGTTPPATPYAIIEDRQGPVSGAYYGGSDLMTVFPCVTLYVKPGPAQGPGDAVQALMALALKVQAARYSVDTHSDGITPFVTGSLNRAGEFPPLADGNVRGQAYLTLRFQAQLLRQ